MRFPQTLPPSLLQDAITELVGSDLSMAEALLNRADLDDLHLLCLRRGPSEPWMERALLALDRGWEPGADCRRHDGSQRACGQAKRVTTGKQQSMPSRTSIAGTMNAVARSSMRA